MKKARSSGIVRKKAQKHPYARYESHPYWNRIDKAISDLANKQDLIERTAREYIVGYLCKTVLKPKKKSSSRKKATIR